MLGEYSLRSNRGTPWVDIQSIDTRVDVAIRRVDPDYTNFNDGTQVKIILNTEKGARRAYLVKGGQVDISHISPRGRLPSELRMLARADLARLVDSLEKAHFGDDIVGYEISFYSPEGKLLTTIHQTQKVWRQVEGIIVGHYIAYECYSDLVQFVDCGQRSVG